MNSQEKPTNLRPPAVSTSPNSHDAATAHDVAERQAPMSGKLRFSVLAAGALLTLGAVAQPVEASGRHRCGRADADSHSLDASMRQSRGGWRVHVEYGVEIEDACRRERFALFLRVTDRGRPILDGRGRPIVFEIPLDRPTDVDRDELEFERGVTLTLPGGAVYDPRNLKLEAKVMRLRDGRVLDRDRDSIDYDRGFRAPRRSRHRRPCQPWRRRGFHMQLGIRSR